MKISGHKIAVELLVFTFFVSKFQRTSNFLSPSAI